MPVSRRNSRTPRSRFTLALLLLTAVTLLALDLPGTGPLDPIRGALGAAFHPIRSAGNAVFRPVANGWKGAFGYSDVKDENARLKDRLAKADSERARIRQLERVNEDLLKQVGLDAGSTPTKSARVTSEPLHSFDRSIEIDRGSDDDVKKGMVVISGGIEGAAVGGQVLGRITRVRSGSSSVMLITDPSFAVGIRLDSDERGTAQGRGRGKDLVVDGIAADAKVAKGDHVETTGLDGSAFPADLQVGRVTKVRAGSSGASKSIEVAPTADLTSVLVKVVLQEASG